MEQSRAKEEAKWSRPGMDGVVQLTTMEADHITSLSPPPPLSPHTPAMQSRTTRWCHLLHSTSCRKYQLWTPPLLIDLTNDDEENSVAGN
jgi:hypothetical protein